MTNNEFTKAFGVDLDTLDTNDLRRLHDYQQRMVRDLAQRVEIWTKTMRCYTDRHGYERDRERLTEAQRRYELIRRVYHTLKELA